MVQILDVMACLSVGLLAGVEAAVSLFVNPVLWRMEERSQVISIRDFAARLGAVMPYWYGFNLLLLMAAVWVHRDDPVRYMLYAAAALWAITIALTLFFLVPINNRLASPQAEEPFDSLVRQHRLWDRRHRLRILAVGGAFGLLLFAVVR